MNPENDSGINCPFYGRALYQFVGPGLKPLKLINTQGNQCALVTDAHSPCQREIDGQSIDWRECPRAQSVRVG